MSQSRTLAPANHKTSAIRAALNDTTAYPREVIGSVVKSFIDNDDLLWASALTYTTALSLVPLLVLMLGVLKSLGYTYQLQPVIVQYVGSSDVADRLLGFAQNLKVSTLGLVGGGSLVITDITLLSTIESALNRCWGVANGRTLLRKVTDYLGLTVTVPVLLVAALTLTAAVMKSAAFLKGLSFLASFILVWAGYFVLFVFFPNTRVRWRPALIGAFATAIVWTFAQWAYIHFQYGVSSYREYYGSLAALPIFLVWVYFSWAIVLLGAELAAVLQRGRRRPVTDVSQPGFTRRATLLILLRVGERMVKRSNSVTIGTIAHELGVSQDHLVPIVTRLEEAGILVRSLQQRGSRQSNELVLARSPQAVRLGEALAAVEKNPIPLEPRVDALTDKIEQTGKNCLINLTVLDLIDYQAPPAQ